MPSTNCCAVTRPGGTPRGSVAADVVICPVHVSEGWTVVQGRWGVRPDAASTWLCGCVTTTLEQISLRKCATHAVGPAACCPAATMRHCVCMYAYDCPTHGTRHHGGHD
jgi:hypothetical protein